MASSDTILNIFLTKKIKCDLKNKIITLIYLNAENKAIQADTQETSSLYSKR